MHCCDTFVAIQRSFVRLDLGLREIVYFGVKLVLPHSSISLGTFCGSNLDFSDRNFALHFTFLINGGPSFKFRFSRKFFFGKTIATGF